MENQTDNETNSEIEKPVPEEFTPVKPKAPRRSTVSGITKSPKPIVEGINSTKSTQDVIFVKPNLSPQEKELLAPAQPEPEMVKVETRLMPESVSIAVNKKDHHVGRWLLIFVVLLILVAGAYGFYIWKLNKDQKPVLGNYHPAETIVDNTVSPSSTPVSIETPPITPGASSTVSALQLKIKSTPTGYLNVRSLPSSAGAVVTQVHPGEVYTYTVKQGGWYQISYSGFEQGWVSSQYVTVVK